MKAIQEVLEEEFNENLSLERKMKSLIFSASQKIFWNTESEQTVLLVDTFPALFSLLFKFSRKKAIGIQLKLKLEMDMKGNKKGFYRNTSNTRKMKENVGYSDKDMENLCYKVTLLCQCL